MLRNSLQHNIFIVSVATLVSLCGCGSQPDAVATFLPKPEAIQRVNRNNDGIEGRLYGKGSWRGRFTAADGSRSSGDGAFDLHLVWPNRFCFQARVLGGKLFDTGCNEDDYWLWAQKGEDRLYLGSRRALAEGGSDNGLPINPGEVLEAMGVGLIEPETLGMNSPRYRVTAKHHQLIYEQELAGGQVVIAKEYWLSRFEPFLIERVLYRNIDGQVTMDARLSNHQPIAGGGPRVARRIEIDWPINQSSLRLNFSRLKLYPDIDKIEFVQPNQRPDLDPRRRRPQETTLLD